MTTDRDAKPVAEGNFSKTPFAHILIYLLERKLVGTLELSDAKNEATIYFRQGMPAKVRSSIQGRNLGRVLVLLKTITDDQLKACEEEIARNGGLQGEVLIRQGVINAPTLVKALREQLLLKLTDIFAMTSASYKFYAKVNKLIGFGPDELFPLDTYPLIMAGMRAYGNRQNLDKICQTFRGQFLSLEDAGNIRRFRLNPAEKALCRDLLKKSHRYDDLIAGGLYEPHVIQYTLYVMLITKLLVTESEPTVIPPGPIDQLISVAPEPVRMSHDPQIIKKKQLIQDKAAAIASQNYYEMLEVPFGAPAEEVRKAFFKAAKEYHPDKVSNEITGELKETLQYVFSNLSEAHATLVDPDSREEYEAAIREGQMRTSIAPIDEENAEVRNALDAENYFQKSIVFLRRGQYDQAEELILKALELNQNEGEYIAVSVHLESRKRPANAKVVDLVEKLQIALETNPKSERMNLYLAQLFKRNDSLNQAQAHFQKVITLNPHNIEAARELRLMQMRDKKEKGRPSGIFKRLFK